MLKYLARLVSRLRNKVSGEFRQTFQCLQGRNFRIYSMGQFVSLCGAWMQNVALSWLVYQLTNSAWMLGLVAFAGSLPMLLLSYFGGMAADRWDRRKLMLFTQSLAMLHASTLCWLTFNHLISIQWVIGLSVFIGCVTALETPTRQAFVIDMLESPDQLVNTIGVNSANNNTTRILGPLLAAGVITTYGEATCFLLNAMSYLGMLTALYNIRIKERSEERKTETASASSFAEFRRMSAELFKDKCLKGMIGLTVVMAVFGLQYQTLMPVITKVLLQGDASLLGMLSAVNGAGALIGSLLLANRGNVKRIRQCIGYACLGLSIALVTMSTSTVVALSMVSVALAAICLNWQTCGTNSMVQSTVNPAIRGRVMAIYTTLMFGFTPFANLVSGWFTQQCGVTTVLAMCSFMIVSATGLYLLYVKSESC